MAKQIVEIGNTGQQLVDKLDNNFTELYDSKHEHSNLSILEKFGEDEESGQPTFNNEPIVGFEDAPVNDLLHGRINNEWQAIPAHSVDLMFFTLENGNPVTSHTAPTTAQIIMPTTHFPVEPDVWHDIITFPMGSDLHGTELEFIPENSFKTKLWIRSDIARDNVQFRLRTIDNQTGTLLAIGTASVNLGGTGIPSPVLITGIYEMPAVVPAENIRRTLQILSPLFGVQISIVSIPPNEISYIAMLISGTAIPGPQGEPGEFFSPNILYSKTIFEEFMRGFLNPLSREVFEPTYYNGPVHGAGANAFMGGVLAQNGKIILVPYASTTVGIYDPITNTYTAGPVHGAGTNAFMGGVLAQNGKIILVPNNSTVIGIYDPVENTYTAGYTVGAGTNKFSGGVLAPNGKIILVPNASTTIGIYDPITDTYITDFVIGTDSFRGGILDVSGKIIIIPLVSTTIGIYDLIGMDIGRGYCLHPYLNKF